MTRKVSAVYTHLLQSPVARLGTTAVSSAMETTAGVYTREKRVIKRSILGLRAAAFSTLSKMRWTMLSASTWVTRSLIAPSV